MMHAGVGLLSSWLEFTPPSRLNVLRPPADTRGVHPSQEARLLASLDHERTWREMLQAKLATVEAAHRQAHEQLVQARLESQRQHQASARTTKICTALQERLLELEATVRQTEQQRAADADTAFDRLTQRHAEFTASLAAAARSRDALTQQLNVARAALEEARQAREAIEIAAADHRRQGQREFEIALAAAAASRADAEQQVESLRAALQQAETRHASERSADAERRAARDTEVAASLAQISDERDELRLQLNAASAALEESQGRRAREEADARATLEQTIERAERAQRETEERYALELAVAASQRDDLQRQFEEALAQA
ncbi:MAG TPA: hypothetical protein VFJ02_10325, partial [Vicinamibacterales bacterium]|nr:hypothetical protein [Vicinamibacterales bacterium]